MMNLYSTVKKVMAKTVKEKDLGLSIPPNQSLGDVSSAVAFSIAKKKGLNPNEVAKSIVAKLKTISPVSEIKAVGPYINFFFDKNKSANLMIKDVFKDKPKKKSKLVSLDTISPNLMKGIHVGNSRNGIIGGALLRILESTGVRVKTISFACDIGLTIAKVVWGYMNLGLKPEGEKGEWLGKIYAITNDFFEKDTKVRQGVYDINKRIYDKEPSIMSVYERLLSWAFDYITSIESKLRVRIDKHTSESAVIPYAMKAVQLLKDKGIAKDSDGALIVDLTKHNLGVYVLLTSQGVPTYEAKDLGLQLMKRDLFKADEYIILTGDEQIMHFQQVIKTLELIGFKKGSIIHKPYALVDIEGEKISSRKGNVMLFNEVINELIHSALNEIVKKNSNLSDDAKKSIASEIAFSSLFYGVLKHDLNKKINFVINDWVKFDGDTGAYLQYSYVRANKILKGNKVAVNKLKITNDVEYELIKKLNYYNEVLNESAKRLNPSLLAHYSFELANLFNKFYENCPVIKEGVNQSRLLIVKAYKRVLGDCMKLMGMRPLIEM